MNKLLSEILEDISQEYSISNDVISPIITKLSAEFYIKLSDFKNLSEQKWAEYQFPDNLYYLLKEKYESIAQKETPTIKADLEVICDVDESNKEYQERNNDNKETNNNIEDKSNYKDNEVNDNNNVDNNKANDESANELEEQINNKKTIEPQLTNEEINEAITNIDN